MVKRLFLALVLLLGALPAFASFPATNADPTACTASPCYIWKVASYNGAEFDNVFNTSSQAKSWWEARIQKSNADVGNPPVAFIWYANGVNFYACENGGCYYTGAVNRYGPVAPSAPQYSCPANSTLSGSSCTCTTGYVESGSSCVVQPINNCPAAGSSAGTNWVWPKGAGDNSSVRSICDASTSSGDAAQSGCMVTFTPTLAVGGDLYGSAVYTGAKVNPSTCTGDGRNSNPIGKQEPPVAGEPAPSPCKAGYAPGSVNGITSCYPAGSTGEKVTVPKKTDTTTTTTTTGVDGNSPTSSSASGETSCVGGKCTTTTTTTTTKTNADGTTSTTTGTSTKEESQEDYCTANPKATMCKEFSLGDLDAKEVANKSVQVGITKEGGFGPENASCPAPKVATVMGISLTMPFTILCEFAVMIRPLLIGFAWLSAALTFFGFARK